MSTPTPTPTPVTPPPPDTALALLRHAVATLAYRAEKVLRDEPEGFAHFSPSPSSRTAVEVMSHLGDLMQWGAHMARGEARWQPGATTDWSAGRDRFFQGLAALDVALTDPAAAQFTAVIFQGPVADALTHVGQLAMMRGMVGASVRPESYARATIQPGRVGPEQAPPGREFDGDASAPKRQ